MVLAIAIWRPGLGAKWFSACELGLAKTARRPWLSGLILLLIVAGGRVCLLPLFPVPHPVIHDEFSYLLAADTYVSGRLTNPTHPLWRSFESVHILQRPTYMSMYPPVQGLLLAAGKKVAGHAWAGTVLSSAAMTLALFWMLRAWFSPSVAFVGTALAAFRWELFSYWINSYWGGSGPAFAGALLLGSLPRLIRKHRLIHAMALAVGIALLLNSRPYEGGLLLISSLSGFAFFALRRCRIDRRFLWKTAGVLAAFLLPVVVAMSYYNRQVTGHAWKLPYIADREQYAASPLLVFQPLRTLPASTESLRRVYAAEVALYWRARTNAGLSEIGRKVKDFWLFFIGPLLTIPILSLWLFRKANDRRCKFFVWVTAVVFGGLLLEVWFYPHYASPATAAIVGLIMLGFVRLRSVNGRFHASAMFLSRAVPLCCVLLGAIPITVALAGGSMELFPLQWYGGRSDTMHDSSLFRDLGQHGNRDLVIVRYAITHDVGREWVYNAADIDHAPIIWARDLDCKGNLALLNYFRDRRVWLFEPDVETKRLQPYLPGKELGLCSGGAKR